MSPYPLPLSRSDSSSWSFDVRVDPYYIKEASHIFSHARDKHCWELHQALTMAIQHPGEYPVGIQHRRDTHKIDISVNGKTYSVPDTSPILAHLAYACFFCESKGPLKHEITMEKTGNIAENLVLIFTEDGMLDSIHAHKLVLWCVNVMDLNVDTKMWTLQRKFQQGPSEDDMKEIKKYMLAMHETLAEKIMHIFSGLPAQIQQMLFEYFPSIIQRGSALAKTAAGLGALGMGTSVLEALRGTQAAADAAGALKTAADGAGALKTAADGAGALKTAADGAGALAAGGTIASALSLLTQLVVGGTALRLAGTAAYHGWNYLSQSSEENEDGGGPQSGSGLFEKLQGILGQAAEKVGSAMEYWTPTYVKIFSFCDQYLADPGSLDFEGFLDALRGTTDEDGVKVVQTAEAIMRANGEFSSEIRAFLKRVEHPKFRKVCIRYLCTFNDYIHEEYHDMIHETTTGLSTILKDDIRYDRISKDFIQKITTQDEEFAVPDLDKITRISPTGDSIQCLRTTLLTKKQEFWTWYQRVLFLKQQSKDLNLTKEGQRRIFCNKDPQIHPIFYYQGDETKYYKYDSIEWNNDDISQSKDGSKRSTITNLRSAKYIEDYHPRFQRPYEKINIDSDSYEDVARKCLHNGDICKHNDSILDFFIFEKGQDNEIQIVMQSNLQGDPQPKNMIDVINDYFSNASKNYYIVHAIAQAWMELPPEKRPAEIKKTENNLGFTVSPPTGNGGGFGFDSFFNELVQMMTQDNPNLLPRAAPARDDPAAAPPAGGAAAPPAAAVAPRRGNPPAGDGAPGDPPPPAGGAALAGGALPAGPAGPEYLKSADGSIDQNSLLLAIVHWMCNEDEAPLQEYYGPEKDLDAYKNELTQNSTAIKLEVFFTTHPTTLEVTPNFEPMKKFDAIKILMAAKAFQEEDIHPEGLKFPDMSKPILDAENNPTGRFASLNLAKIAQEQQCQVVAGILYCMLKVAAIYDKIDFGRVKLCGKSGDGHSDPYFWKSQPQERKGYCLKVDIAWNLSNAALENKDNNPVSLMHALGADTLWDGNNMQDASVLHDIPQTITDYCNPSVKDGSTTLVQVCDDVIRAGDVFPIRYDGAGRQENRVYQINREDGKLEYIDNDGNLKDNLTITVMFHCLVEFVLTAPPDQRGKINTNPIRQKLVEGLRNFESKFIYFAQLPLNNNKVIVFRTNADNDKKDFWESFKEGASTEIKGNPVRLNSDEQKDLNYFYQNVFTSQAVAGGAASASPIQETTLASRCDVDRGPRFAWCKVGEDWFIMPENMCPCCAQRARNICS